MGVLNPSVQLAPSVSPTHSNGRGPHQTLPRLQRGRGNDDDSGRGVARAEGTDSRSPEASKGPLQNHHYGCLQMVELQRTSYTFKLCL